jgi:hypothetical protein
MGTIYEHILYSILYITIKYFKREKGTQQFWQDDADAIELQEVSPVVVDGSGF